MRRSPLSVAIVFAAIVPLGTTFAAAQEPGASQAINLGRGMAGMQRAQGEVTAIDGATLTVKAEDGTVYRIVTTDNTRIMRATGGMGMGPGMGRGNGGQPPVAIKASEIKVGDGAMGMGQMDASTKTLHAAILVDTDAATIKALRDNLGKTYITGRVTAVDLDNAKLTLERPDKVSQTIQLDESTSFRRGGRGMRANATPGAGAAPAAAAAPPQGEAITLADIKVGDSVGGPGAVKNGAFVPSQLMVATPGQGGGRRNGGEPAAAAPAAK